jgi:biopolymer transport protein ExbD
MKWVALLILAGCISPVMHFGSGKSATQAQHDTLEEFTPTKLSTEGTWHGPVAEAKIRVYADDEYRAQNIRWQQTFGEELEYANAVLGRQFGVKLVADYRVWNHHAPGHGLPEDLAELHALDPGDDVLSVIGLTSSLSLASATFDLLGLAGEPGRHVMLRGYADLEERKAFALAFPDLTSDERDTALESRRRHKTAAVLLHELAHNLGAPHETISDTLMNATYSEHAVAFSAEAHAIIQRGLDQRLGRETSAPVVVDAAPPPVAKVHKALVVHVTADRVTLDDLTEDESGLSMRFSVEAAYDKDTEVIFHKDKGVPSSRLVEVIDRAKAAGLTKITIQ